MERLIIMVHDYYVQSLRSRGDAAIEVLTPPHSCHWDDDLLVLTVSSSPVSNIPLFLSIVGSTSSFTLGIMSPRSMYVGLITNFANPIWLSGQIGWSASPPSRLDEQRWLRSSIYINKDAKEQCIYEQRWTLKEPKSYKRQRDEQPPAKAMYIS